MDLDRFAIEFRQLRQKVDQLTSGGPGPASSPVEGGPRLTALIGELKAGFETLHEAFPTVLARLEALERTVAGLTPPATQENAPMGSGDGPGPNPYSG